MQPAQKVLHPYAFLKCLPNAASALAAGPIGTKLVQHPINYGLRRAPLSQKRLTRDPSIWFTSTRGGGCEMRWTLGLRRHCAARAREVGMPRHGNGSAPRIAAFSLAVLLGSWILTEVYGGDRTVLTEEFTNRY